MSDVTITSTSNDTIDVVGLDKINVGLTLGLPQPFKTEGSNTYDIKPLSTDNSFTIDIKPLNADLKLEPLRTDSHATLDLKPVVLDLCLTLNIGKVPSFCIRQPYRHRIGFSLFGMEVWGFSFSGEQETIIEERGPRPQIAAGGASWPPAEPYRTERAEPHASGGGLRVRLGR
jgi:hypothetical protein